MNTSLIIFTLFEFEDFFGEVRTVCLVFVIWMRRSKGLNLEINLRMRCTNGHLLTSMWQTNDHVNLQSSQQVAGLSQSGPCCVQLLQKLVLCLFQCRDLSLSCSDVLLPLLHLLLQPNHLQGGEIDKQLSETEKINHIHNLFSVPYKALLSA